MKPEPPNTVATRRIAMVVSLPLRSDTPRKRTSQGAVYLSPETVDATAGGGYIARPPFCPHLSRTNCCPDGGIGRRAGFRYLWPQGRGSSSLLLGTNNG